MRNRYDGTLVGCAVYTFISLNSHKPADVDNAGLMYAFILAGVGGLVHSAVSNSSQLPALTAAFNIVMVLFMVAIGRGTSDTATLNWTTPYDSFADMSSANNTIVEDDGDVEEKYDSFSAVRLWRATVLGVGQFIFVNTDVGAVLVIAAVLICSRKAAFMALLGSLAGTLVSCYVVNVPKDSYGALWTGLYSYNCMGTAVAIGGGTDPYCMSMCPYA